MLEDDRDLYEGFQALRREEKALVPPISMPARTAHRHGQRRLLAGGLVVAVACVTVLIAGTLWLLPGLQIGFRGQNHSREQAAASITMWKPATDFLLDTPGRELLQHVPTIGEWNGEGIAPRPGERHRPIRKQVSK